jgi:GDSL-like Lipase/Acylhydrolase
MILPGNVPTGCIPIILTIYASTNKLDYDHLGCLKKYNAIGFYHNLKLKELAAQLQNSYPQARIIYADYYEPMIQFLQNPDKFGKFLL